MRPFRHRQFETDWSNFVDLPPEDRKERLLEECKRNDVSIHINDQTETSSGAYSLFRPIASEAELERRLITKLMLKKTTWSNCFALISLLVSAISLAISIFKHT